MSYVPEEVSIPWALDSAYRAGDVRRFHTHRMIFDDTVARHSYGVAWCVIALSHPVHPSAQLLMAALQHDGAEFVFGDIPSPARTDDQRNAEEDLLRAAPWGNFSDELTEQERELLKLADRMDGYIRSGQEVRSGNRGLLQTFNNYGKMLPDNIRVPLNRLFQIGEYDARK